MADGDRWFFDRFAPVYDIVMPAMDPADLTVGFDYAERSVERVLDIGGGTGRAVRQVRQSDRILLDISRAMLERSPSGIERLQATATALPLVKRSVDAVLIIDALHHMLEPRTIIAEAKRVLRPGGIVLIRDFNRQTFRGRGLAVVESVIGMESEFFTHADLRRVLETADLTPYEIERSFVSAIVGRKPV